LKEAFSEARRLKHAHTLAVVLIAAIAVERDRRSAELQRYVGELMALSIEQRFPFFWVTQRYSKGRH
jgi:hypothetical protein